MASKKTDRQIRDANRNKALELLAPNLLDAAEAVGKAAHEWEQAERIAEEKAEAYRQAWATALENSWKAEQLDQLPTVNARPPRKRPTTTKANNTASKAEDSSTAGTNTQSAASSNEPAVSSNGHHAESERSAL